ncbi:PepSY-associated TM helix domain-containing protein [Gluconacetobacter takamatsuzukensis]|uniref:PepSY domain-containing protein n=1 Tax=Gluconacetobacter takamatsuzukensis TaxID=1286190 RepID=A0A7W4KD53_9PROT|nr:PepSY-associated TM helix domain-containing protein [Gluconacetobacter takamatsuzukensis]MBB2204762.1 PepSY domain-containing protein [Gluconacetobacter takamatsuzukensis]
MRDVLRTRMGWLHAWVGFVGGLVLVVAFTGGTLALFDTEITRWMQPELAALPAAAMTGQALDHAGAQVWALREKGQIVFLNLPSARDPVLRILHYDGHAFVGPVLDPRDGVEVKSRATEGGQLFFDLHQSLYRGPVWGNLMTEAAGIGLIVAVISGVIIHWRNLVPDLLLFRPFAAPGRAWLDAHIMAGVLLLPFVTMMAYTGAVIHAPRLFPMIGAGHAAKAASRAGGGERRDGGAYAPLAPIFAQAEEIFGRGRIGFVMFGSGTVSFYRADAADFAMTRDHADFSAVDGKLVGVTRVGHGMRRLDGAMRGLHFIRWGTPGLRWLYFVGGVVGSMMMSAGLVLFLMKHRRGQGGGVMLGLAETLALAVTLGLPLAALGFLWGNRLLPADLAHRAELETRIFFLLWLGALVHAALRCFRGAVRHGWREQACGIAVLGCALPFLDIVSRSGTGVRLHWDLYLGVDACALGFGLLALWGQRMMVRAR